MTYYDDIEVLLLPDKVEEPNHGNFDLDQDEIDSFKLEPFKHQVEAINYGLQPEHRKWLLLDSMGLGKSAEIIWYAETLKNRGLIDHCLIICGVDSLRQNWKREIMTFSNQSVLVLGEKITRTGRIHYAPLKERLEILKNPIEEFFVVINAAALRDDKIIDAIRKSKTNRFGFIAVDEVHKFATKTSKQGTNLLKLESDYKVAATGTLIMNSPISCYVPLAWTENDKSILTTFKGQYCVYDTENTYQIIGYRNLDVLKEELQSCMIRRTLDEVRDDMPPKMITYETIEMTDEHRKFYDAIKDGVKEEADKIELNSSNLLALTTRLRQATAAPEVLTTQDIVSSKVLRAAEIAEELAEQGEKVVIFSTFKSPVYKLAELLEKYHPMVNTGDQDASETNRNMVNFQNDPNSLIFLGTHSLCGTGFTLNAASYLICIDTPYTYAALSQSTDRIWRVTNTRPARIYVLTCTDTIDERVQEIVESKKALSDQLMSENEYMISDDLSKELFKVIKEL